MAEPLLQIMYDYEERALLLLLLIHARADITVGLITCRALQLR